VAATATAEQMGAADEHGYRHRQRYVVVDVPLSSRQPFHGRSSTEEGAAAAKLPQAFCDSILVEFHQFNSV